MTENHLPSPEVLRQLLRYEPETGKLFWRSRGREWFRSERAMNAWNARFAGAEAFYSVHKDGYLQGNIFRLKRLAHRVAFALMSGRWPIGEIDHIDGDRKNNRPENLREANRYQNCRNSRSRVGSTSAFLGVCRKRNGKWHAQIRIGGRQVHLGYFLDERDAAVAYDKAANKAFGEFARLNFLDARP